MMNDVLYHEGDQGVLEHTFVFHFGNAGLSGTRASGVTRYVEFWCQLNCKGRWQISESMETLSVGFDRGLDVVLFKLSEEYSRFATVSNSIVHCPHHV